MVAGADGALGAIKDPLSRLVAAGVLFQIGRLTPNAVTIATQTALTKVGVARFSHGWVLQSVVQNNWVTKMKPCVFSDVLI